MRYQLQTENQAGLNEIAKCMGESSGPGIHLVFSFSLLQEKCFSFYILIELMGRTQLCH